MEYDELVIKLKEKLNSLGYTINFEEISDILIKRMASSNVGGGSASTHQYHIALTGRERYLFPYLENPGYSEERIAFLNKRESLRIPVLIFNKNIAYLNSKSDGEEGMIKTFTTSSLGVRPGQAEQTGLGDKSLDDPKFSEFKKLIKENDFLIVLRYKSVFEYIFLVIKSEDCQDIQDLKGVYLRERNPKNPEFKTSIDMGSVQETDILKEKTIESNEFEDYRKKGQIQFITFHPSYGYEEFIEGISFDENGGYIKKDGIFKKLCFKAIYAVIADKTGTNYSISKESDYDNIKEKVLDFIENEFIVDWESALIDPEKKFVLIIDEINRGDISKIFGELITLLEADKRLGGNFPIKVKLPYTNDLFIIPPNLFIIATMNTADRSIALIDIALRRRFGFYELSPEFDDESFLVKNHRNNNTYDLVKNSIEALKLINKRIADPNNELGREKCIGHSFLIKVTKEEDLELVWITEILPLLEEYCYSNSELMNKILFDGKEYAEFVSRTTGINKQMDYKRLVDSILKSQARQ